MSQQQKQNDTIYYDVTHLVGWQGVLTGIPRFTDEIARRLKSNSEVKFISWDDQNSRFYLVDMDVYYERVAEVNRKIGRERDPKKSIQKVSLARKAVRVIFDFPLLGLPLKHAYRKAKKISSKNILDLGTIELAGDGSTFFTACGVWDRQAYLDLIKDHKKRGGKIVVVSHDIIPLVVPQFNGQLDTIKDFTRQVTSIADYVFCASKNTEKDLTKWLENYSLRIPEMSVIRQGDNYTITKPVKPKFKKFLKTYKDGMDFGICVGTIEARKNHTVLYYTYKLAASLNIDLPTLYIIGRPGYRTENIIDIIKDDIEINNKLIILNGVNDDELEWLYQHCKFTVYPSFYEGWGIPISESLSRGIPSIASQTSSMIEVAPDHAIYFNPCSPEQLMNNIVKLSDKKTYQDYVKLAKTYQSTSWDQTYRSIVDELKIKNIVGGQFK